MAMPIPTTQDLIEEALRKSGVVGIDESIEEPVLNSALADYNDLVAQWNHQRYLVYHLAEYSFVSTGADSYTVGAGQNFNIDPRPDRLEYAFLRQPENNGATPIDWPMTVISAKEDYNSIIVKKIGTFATAIFYDPAYPVGILKPWPIPQAGIYEIHITVKQTLQRTSDIKTPCNMPPEYYAALKWNLAMVLRESYQMPPSQQLNNLAKRALNVLRMANTAVPTLKMPSTVRRNGGYAYNYRSDQP